MALRTSDEKVMNGQLHSSKFDAGRKNEGYLDVSDDVKAEDSLPQKSESLLLSFVVGNPLANSRCSKR